jgi:hypothetical protein
LEQLTITEETVRRALVEWHTRAATLPAGARQERQVEADKATPEQYAKALAPWLFTLLQRNAS